MGDAVSLYPVQTATNLMPTRLAYYDARTVLRFGFAILTLTLVITIGFAVPYWSLLSVPRTH